MWSGFARILRLHDNLSLAAACRNSSARVLALYIATPRQWATHNMSPRQAGVINAASHGLQIALAEKVFLYCSVKWMTLSPVSR
ncbi:deoxyribodipyrimidine photo-lyase [Escherichia coli]